MKYTSLVILLFSCNLTFSQDYIREYISKCVPLAIEQEERYRIPASITLAQAILESGYGRSSLARNQNNHFGIKSGMKYRVYASIEDSFEHHSVVLLSNRYRSLFELDVSDYRGWAYGLQRCGYAEDSLYARKLIIIIEKHKLNIVREEISP